ncbi:putative chitinase [Paucibacter oligotrophus]|uniref:Putative chitinase n=1 Tax=Roseateles oligotrophus TaxID=1769250 RepID=A0A840LGS6_9BURK|nr:chitinase [Roseateles oligotrophus]MBB4844487.1 putative chitinase [Roseateles oligotrophus]
MSRSTHCRHGRVFTLPLLLALLLGACAQPHVAAKTETAEAAGEGQQFLPSEAQFEQLFPQRLPFYSYAGFVAAARSFSGFAAQGPAELRRQEMAAFLANIAHESDSLKAVREYNQANYDHYCSLAEGRSCAPGQQYYGRGPIQLSWNYQYLAAGQALGEDLWAEPDRVAREPKLAWQTAIWYWMSQPGPASVPAHQAMVAGAGFGASIRAINGALECDQAADSAAARQIARRIDFYRRAAALFNVPPGPRLGC